MNKFEIPEDATRGDLGKLIAVLEEIGVVPEEAVTSAISEIMGTTKEELLAASEQNEWHNMTKGDLETLVKKLIINGAVPEGKVALVLRKIMAGTSKETRQIFMPPKQSELSMEEAELRDDLEGQYLRMGSVFEKYEISTAGMPPWEAIVRHMTPEILNAALKLRKPTLLLIPPSSRKSKIETIDSHPVDGQRNATIIYKPGDDNLWNGGKKENGKEWRVVIVEGMENVESHPEITKEGAKNFQMVKDYLQKYQLLGLDVINDADTYLTLMMVALANGQKIDTQSFTALNAMNVADADDDQTVRLQYPDLNEEDLREIHDQNMTLALGTWETDRILLFNRHPANSNLLLRLRALVYISFPRLKLSR
jgi:hypothetical protein